MCAAAITRGDIMVQNVIPKHLEAISAKLIELGCEVMEFDEAVRVVGRPKQRHTDIKTLPYPGFPTDMQPQMTVTPVSYTHLIGDSKSRNFGEILHMIPDNFRPEGGMGIRCRIFRMKD